jgi:hypothetical protein
VELGSIPQQTRERIEGVGTADLVVGIILNGNTEARDAIATVREAVGKLSGAARTVLLHGDGAQNPLPAESAAAEEDQSLVVLSDRLFGTDTAAPGQRMADVYQSIFAVGDKLGARACCLVASDLQTVTVQWVHGLVQPVLEMDYDLATPCYAHHKFEGLLNSSIISPLNRALYGRRIENPMGPDMALSKRAFQRILGTDGKAGRERLHPLASLAPALVSGGFPVCQVRVGVRLYPPTDWTNLSSLLAQILGPVFLEMERNVAAWQKARGSQPVPTFGEHAFIPEQTESVEVQRMVESFQVGIRNLQEIWGLVLPPATLFELRKLSRVAPEQFRMTDDLWARIVYDFALGHRLRTISREHLLRAMTPLYLGWVASYALEMETAGADIVEQRLDKLSQAYEAAKPYLVSRWRWPDRFNP